jgi:hypothetical protein
MASFDSEFATVRDWRELKEDMGSHVLVVATVTRDVDFLSIRSDDFEARRPRVDQENRAGAERGGEGLIARDFGLLPGKVTGK